MHRAAVVRLVLVGLAAVLLVIGCASSGNKRIMDASFMDGLKIGVTTKDEVKALLGEPQETRAAEAMPTSPGGMSMEQWRYIGTNSSVNAAAFIPLVDIFAGKQTHVARCVDIWFEPNGIVGDIEVKSDMKENVMPIGTLMAAGAAAGAGAGYAASPYRSGYYGRPGKTTINTIPTGGGGYMTTIKRYK